MHCTDAFHNACEPQVQIIWTSSYKKNQNVDA